MCLCMRTYLYECFAAEGVLIEASAPHRDLPWLSEIHPKRWQGTNRCGGTNLSEDPNRLTKWPNSTFCHLQLAIAMTHMGPEEWWTYQASKTLKIVDAVFMIWASGKYTTSIVSLVMLAIMTHHFQNLLEILKAYTNICPSCSYSMSKLVQLLRCEEQSMWKVSSDPSNNLLSRADQPQWHPRHFLQHRCGWFCQLIGHIDNGASSWKCVTKRHWGRPNGCNCHGQSLSLVHNMYWDAQTIYRHC